MLPFITADHFRLLLDGTGKPFAEFMDRVLRATAAKLGVTPAQVHTNLRVNLADGGVDTQIDQGNDPEGHLAGGPGGIQPAHPPGAGAGRRLLGVFLQALVRPRARAERPRHRGPRTHRAGRSKERAHPGRSRSMKAASKAKPAVRRSP